MRLKKLQLENFRNHGNFVLEFPENSGGTLIIGQNGRGKTNIIEAISILSLTKSFRTVTPADLVGWDKEFYRLNCTVFDEENVDLETFYSPNPLKRSYKINDVPTVPKKFIGNLLTVIFHPEDLNLLYLSPSLRRRYLDIILSQTDIHYIDALNSYKKSLKQRNALLSTRRTQDLSIWNRQLAEFGARIIKKRQNYLEFTGQIIENNYISISEGTENLHIIYRTICNDLPESEQEITEIFIDLLEQNQKKDLERGVTTIGPHRDDVVFYINNRDICTFASRGEYRTLLLALKMSEINYITQIKNTAPIVLLDDVLSELDPLRQKHLMNALSNCHAIITTTDLDSHPEITQDIKDYKVVNL